MFQLWLLINFKLVGLNPAWWHLTSLLLHLIVVTLVFVLARLVINDDLIAGSSALLFAVLPVHVEAVILLATLVVVFGIVTVRQTSIWASDFALASRGMEVAPHNKMAANNYAKELALRGEYAQAVPIFHQVIERRPNYWLPTFNLGLVYYQLGDLPQAERYLRRAINIFPEHRYLGFTLLELKRNAEAETELRTAIARQPNVQDQHFALGTLLEEKGALAEALSAYKTEREINPKQPEVNAKIADLESRLSRSSSK